MDNDDRYLEYRVSRAFPGMEPDCIISTPEALRRIADEEGATYKELPMTNRRRRRAKAIRKAGGVRKVKR